MGIPIFWVEQIKDKYTWTYSTEEPALWGCNAHADGHQAEKVVVGQRHGQSEYPTQCDCGFTFSEKAEHHGHGRPFYRRLDNGQELASPLPPGACYALDDDDAWCTGFDGKSIVCVLPNGDHWYIDSRASNCTMKGDSVHRCWVRHGTVGERLHVDKNGNTCQAGAGSIHSGSYHGFLHNGELT